VSSAGGATDGSGADGAGATGASSQPIVQVTVMVHGTVSGFLDQAQVQVAITRTCYEAFAAGERVPDRQFEQEPDVEVVGEASDGRAALDAIRKLSPDVVLLDMMMPVLDGKRVLDALRAGESVPPGEPGPAVVVLTSYTGDDEAIDAVRAGALSYLRKAQPSIGSRTRSGRPRRGAPSWTPA
jgi:CheY-like chemotaxis protein